VVAPVVIDNEETRRTSIMHSIAFKGPNGYKGVIHHNGDWSGPALVTWGPDNDDASTRGWTETAIPGWLAQAMLPPDDNIDAEEDKPAPAKPTTIREWCAAAYARAAAKGFHADDDKMSERERLSVANNNIIGEVSELWEAYRDGKLREPCDKAARMVEMGLRPLTCIEEELADIHIRNCDNAASFGVDLQSAAEIKHAYNGTRVYKHGGKLA